MIRGMTIGNGIVASLALCLLSVRNAGAFQVTLNLVQFESRILQTGEFAALPMLPQDGIGGTTDFNPALASNYTTFQGTITVDVDNVMAPTSIRILSSAADADVGGYWLPEMQPHLDNDADAIFGEFYDDGLPTAGNDPAPASAADWGARILHSGFGVNLAWSAHRDVVYNVTMPAALPVDGQGEFISTTENFEFATGWFDYWVTPAAGNVRGRSNLAGVGDDNASPMKSKYTVTPLSDVAKEIKLFIPIDVDALGDELNFFFNGQFVATAIVPVGEQTLGDYDGDRDVDGADFLKWQRALGTNDSMADGDDSGMVGPEDLTIWQDHFGEVAESASSSSVPEPASLTLLTLLVLGSAKKVGRRRC